MKYHANVDAIECMPMLNKRKARSRNVLTQNIKRDHKIFFYGPC